MFLNNPAFIYIKDKSCQSRKHHVSRRNGNCCFLVAGECAKGVKHVSHTHACEPGSPIPQCSRKKMVHAGMGSAPLSQVP